MSSILPLHTSCKDCVFAIYDNKTQKGCELGRLDKYREKGVEIIEAFDNDLEFDIVNGHQCVAYRHMGPNSQWYQDTLPEERIAKVRREITVRTDVIIPVSSDSDIALLPQTLKSARELELAPLSVVVVNNQEDVKAGAIISLLNKEASGLNWTLSDIKEKTNDGKKVSTLRAIDIASSKLKGHFYTVLNPGDTLPPSFTKDLDVAVTDELKTFVVLLPNRYQVGLTVARGFHQASVVEGNKPVTVEVTEDGVKKTMVLNSAMEKAIFFADQHNLPNLVAYSGDICPSLS